MKGGMYHIDGGIYQGIYLGIYQGIYHLDILLIPWYIPWYIAKVVYTTFGVVYTMTQPSRCGPRVGTESRVPERGVGGMWTTETVELNGPDRRRECRFVQSGRTLLFPVLRPGRTSATGITVTFFPELSEPARPAAARPVSRAGGRRASAPRGCFPFSARRCFPMLGAGPAKAFDFSTYYVLLQQAWTTGKKTGPSCLPHLVQVIHILPSLPCSPFSFVSQTRMIR